MLKQRFLALLAVVWSVLAVGCAGTTASSGAVTSGAQPQPIQPSAAGVPEPKAQTFSASASVAVCMDTAISGGISYLETLNTARSMDGESVDKPPAGDTSNDAWKKRLSAIAATTTAKDCQDKAHDLAGVLGRRYTIAQSLCDLRQGDGGGKAFKEATRTQIDALVGALREASKKQRLEECQKTAAETQKDLLVLVDTANAECSPRNGDHDVVCSAALARNCNGGSEPAEVVAGCLQSAPSAARAIAERSPSEPNAQARAVGAGGGLESAILTGAADFFVERAEQEMSLFAVEVVGRELCAGDSPVKDYLPKTCALIGPAAGDEADIGPTPGAIRAVAKADLDALPTSLVAKIHEKDPNLGCAAAFGWIVADEVGHGSDLITLLKNPKPIVERDLVKKYCADGAKQDVDRLAKYLEQLLSGAPELVANQMRSGNFERMVSTNRDLTAGAEADAKVAAALTQSRAVLSEVLRRLVELDRAITAYHSDPTTARRVLMVVAAIQTVEPILAHLARDSQYQRDIHTAVDLFSQLLNQQYTEAIVTVSSFQVTTLLSRRAQNLLGLSAGLAQADSSDDVKKTLQDATLPLGSWRRKNVPRWGITLTGMVGGTGGYEFVTEKAPGNVEVSNGATLAPTLLVGADLHHGLGGSRLGLHFNLLDLGALATTRLDQPKATNTDTNADTGSVDENPDVRIEQVFAPGLFAYFGWGPFAVGPMASFVPSLRSYKDPNGDIHPLTVFRVGGVLAIDVSVLPLL